MSQLTPAQVVFTREKLQSCFDEIMFFDNLVYLNEGQIYLLADVLMSLSCESYFRCKRADLFGNQELIFKSQMADYLEAIKPHLIEVCALLTCEGEEGAAQSDAFKEVINNLYPDVKFDEIVASTDSISQDHVIIYKAKNGELVVKFCNQDARDAYLEGLKEANGGEVAIIPSQFRRGIQFEGNPGGLQPVCYEGANNRIFYMTYSAGFGENASNFGTKKSRDYFTKNLGFFDHCEKRSLSTCFPGRGPQEQTSYKSAGKLLFNTFDDKDGYQGPTQSTAIYFNRDAELFRQSNTYYKINRETGEITVGMIPNQSSAQVQAAAGGGGAQAAFYDASGSGGGAGIFHSFSGGR